MALTEAVRAMIFCGRHTKRPSFDGLFVYDWEDWMKRSFVSCKY